MENSERKRHDSSNWTPSIGQTDRAAHRSSASNTPAEDTGRKSASARALPARRGTVAAPFHPERGTTVARGRGAVSNPVPRFQGWSREADPHCRHDDVGQPWDAAGDEFDAAASIAFIGETSSDAISEASSDTVFQRDASDAGTIRDARDIDPRIRPSADAGRERPMIRLHTTVTTETARTIIARNTSPDVPFDRSLNAYRGCEHGCVYCFARPTHADLDFAPGIDFETRLFA